MYCRKCYAKLDQAPFDPLTDFHNCPQCNRAFDPANKSTYLARPFPGIARIIRYVIATTIVSLIVAFIVSFFQLVGASGH